MDGRPLLEKRVVKERWPECGVRAQCSRNGDAIPQRFLAATRSRGMMRKLTVASSKIASDDDEERTSLISVLQYQGCPLFVSVSAPHSN